MMKVAGSSERSVYLKQTTGFLPRKTAVSPVTAVKNLQSHSAPFVLYLQSINARSKCDAKQQGMQSEYMCTLSVLFRALLTSAMY